MLIFLNSYIWMQFQMSFKTKWFLRYSQAKFYKAPISRPKLSYYVNMLLVKQTNKQT